MTHHPIAWQDAPTAAPTSAPASGTSGAPPAAQTPTGTGPVTSTLDLWAEATIAQHRASYLSPAARRTIIGKLRPRLGRPIGTDELECSFVARTWALLGGDPSALLPWVHEIGQRTSVGGWVRKPVLTPGTISSTFAVLMITGDRFTEVTDARTVTSARAEFRSSLQGQRLAAAAQAAAILESLHELPGADRTALLSKVSATGPVRDQQDLSETLHTFTALALIGADLKGLLPELEFRPEPSSPAAAELLQLENLVGRSLVDARWRAQAQQAAASRVLSWTSALPARHFYADLGALQGTTAMTEALSAKTRKVTAELHGCTGFPALTSAGGGTKVCDLDVTAQATLTLLGAH